MRAKAQRRTRAAAGLCGVRGAHGMRKKEGLTAGPAWQRVRGERGAGLGRKKGVGGLGCSRGKEKGEEKGEGDCAGLGCGKEKKRQREGRGELGWAENKEGKRNTLLI